MKYQGLFLTKILYLHYLKYSTIRPRFDKKITIYGKSQLMVYMIRIAFFGKVEIKQLSSALQWTVVSFSCQALIFSKKGQRCYSSIENNYFIRFQIEIAHLLEMLKRVKWYIYLRVNNTSLLS